MLEPDSRHEGNAVREPHSKRRPLAGWLIAAAAAVLILLLALRGADRRFDALDFRSDLPGQAAEKHLEDDPTVKGIFVYGPYISLQKGRYRFELYYETSEERHFEVTADYGKTVLYDGTLKPGQTSEPFMLDVEQAITDNSVEVRTYYQGTGLLDFYGMRLQKRGWMSGLAAPMAILLLPVILVLAFKRRLPAGYALYAAVMGLAGAAAYTAGPLSREGLWLAVMLGMEAAVTVLSLLFPRFGERLRQVNVTECLIWALTAYLAVSTGYVLTDRTGLETIALVQHISPGWFLAFFLLGVHLLAALRLVTGRKAAAEVLLIPAAACFGAACVIIRRNAAGEETLTLAVGIIVILCFFFYYITGRLEKPLGRVLDRQKSYRGVFVLICVLAAAEAVFFSVQTICRYRVFGASCFDFGIFAQMFENMAARGLPLTTCERGYEVSHFYIHFSPFFYLLLPFYMAFRTPETLLVLQAFFVCGAVVPFFLICRQMKLKPALAGLLSCVYLASPALLMPMFYDFHENVYFPFFLLWFLYFYISGKDRRMLVFLFLSLMIKEEGAIYASVASLYFILDAKNTEDRKKGAVVLAVSVIWFAGVMAYIASGGLGLMEGHYGLYYMAGQSGTAAMAENIALDPGFFLKNVFNPDNVPYIFYTLGTLLFIPLASKKPYRLILLVPFVAFGLMTDYAYQHDIGFQYTYGLMTLMLFLYLVNVSAMSRRLQLAAALGSLCAALLLGYSFKGKGLTYYAESYLGNREYFDAEHEYIAGLDLQGSVAADSFILPHLWKQKELYEVDVLPTLKTDYVVIWNNSGYAFYKEKYVNDYELMEKNDQFGVCVYKKKA